MRRLTPREKVAQSLGELAEAFLVSKQVAGCTKSTLFTYRWWLNRFIQSVGTTTPDSLATTRFFAGLQSRGLSVSSVHQAYRSLKTFLRWCVECGALDKDPMRGFKMRTPKTLPIVPTDEELERVLAACKKTPMGKRNRALILVLADTGLRAAEVLHLLVEHWNPMQRSLFVRGKGRKDRTGFLNPAASRALRESLSSRRMVALDDFLFVSDDGQPLKERYLISILHRLSHKAGLPLHRRLHPNALRHFAATSWLRNGMGLDEVRRLLGHASLSTTLRYSALVASDLAAAHKKAAAIERLRLE